MPPVISVSGLSKEYLLGARERRHDTFYEKLAGILGNPFRRYRQLAGDVEQEQRFWALQDVSFEVREGEVVGIIGRNGAGKSTLLKILSRITEPTRGRVTIRGRVASLLEVGTGFHPELTGRENIYLNGAILGMSRRDIGKRFDAIVAFAEVEKFLDTPIKRYSSGMYVRLAFAVAAHLEPDVLLVDEVLAVGDAEFQRKCLTKMGEVGGQGRTVLFVSHNMVAVQSLCGSAMWLDRGMVRQTGMTQDVVHAYLGSGLREERVKRWDRPDTAPGTAHVKILSVVIAPAGGTPSSPLDMDSDFTVSVEYLVKAPLCDAHITLHIYDENGILAFSAYDRRILENPREMRPGRYRDTCSIPGKLMNSGRYRIEVLIVEHGVVRFILDDAGVFDISDDKSRCTGYLGREPGVVHPALPWKIEALSAPS